MTDKVIVTDEELRARLVALAASPRLDKEEKQAVEIALVIVQRKTEIKERMRASVESMRVSLGKLANNVGAL